MANFEKLNNGKIRARIYMGDGKTKSKSFSNKTDAKRWALENETNKLNGVTISGRDELYTDVYDEWFRDIQAPAIAESSYKNYYNAGRINHKLFEGYTLGDFEDLRKIQTVLDDYGKTVAQKTIEEYLKKTPRVLRYALLQRKITHNITRALKAHGKKKTAKVNRPLTMTEFNKLRSYLFDNIDVKFNVLVLLATETGARRGELLALTPSDLLTDSFEISFTKSLSPDTDELNMKTEKSERNVTISERVFNIVKAIPANDKGRIFDDDDFKQAGLLHNLLDEIGIDQTTFHGLRDSHASYMFAKFGEAQADQAIMYISKRLGHADIMTTQKYYLDLMPESKMKQDTLAVDFLNDAI
ncbi:site-specific integrase [Weissella soli]|uniref:site-specific integrase n=1 Tax=Weissella soli TaxID=155866 RepID=UPI00359F8D47